MIILIISKKLYLQPVPAAKTSHNILVRICEATVCGIQTRVVHSASPKDAPISISAMQNPDLNTRHYMEQFANFRGKRISEQVKHSCAKQIKIE